MFISRPRHQSAPAPVLCRFDSIAIIDIKTGGEGGISFPLLNGERSFTGSSFQIECGRNPGILLCRGSHVTARIPGLCALVGERGREGLRKNS